MRKLLKVGDRVIGTVGTTPKGLRCEGVITEVDPCGDGLPYHVRAPWRGSAEAAYTLWCSHAKLVQPKVVRPRKPRLLPVGTEVLAYCSILDKVGRGVVTKIEPPSLGEERDPRTHYTYEVRMSYPTEKGEYHHPGAWCEARHVFKLKGAQS